MAAGEGRAAQSLQLAVSASVLLSHRVGASLTGTGCRLHPAVLAGAVEVLKGQTMKSVQEACACACADATCVCVCAPKLRQAAAQTRHIAPASAVVSGCDNLHRLHSCSLLIMPLCHFAAGPESEGGLQLRSFRSKDGLSASVRLRPEFQASLGPGATVLA